MCLVPLPPSSPPSFLALPFPWFQLAVLTAVILVCVGLTEHCRARSQADLLPSQEWKPITDIICPAPNISLMKLNRAASLPRMHTAQQVQPWPQLGSFTDLAACSPLSAVPSHYSSWPHLLQENLFCFSLACSGQSMKAVTQPPLQV